VHWIWGRPRGSVDHAISTFTLRATSQTSLVPIWCHDRKRMCSEQVASSILITAFTCTRATGTIGSPPTSFAASQKTIRSTEVMLSRMSQVLRASLPFCPNVEAPRLSCICKCHACAGGKGANQNRPDARPTVVAIRRNLFSERSVDECTQNRIDTRIPLCRTRSTLSTRESILMYSHGCQMRESRQAGIVHSLENQNAWNGAPVRVQIGATVRF
jgi:hypothetical protein